MSKPTIRIHDLENDEIIDREMTDNEYSDYLSALETDRLVQEEKIAKENEKKAILEKLGLSQDEANLILGL